MESPARPENSQPIMVAAAIGELVKGREFAARLGSLLPPEDPLTAEIVEEVLRSFSRAISALESGGTPEPGPDLAGNGVGSPCSDDRRSEVFGGKRKIGPVTDRRGGRRKRIQPCSWRREISKSMDDGYSWRKYGQKEIHSAKFPRSYFRCTHKHDQGCQATRQVQKSEEDPSLFIITYMGEHSCRDQALMKPSNPMDSRLISFESNTSSLTQEAPLPSTSFPSQKPSDCDEDVVSNLTPDSSSSEYLKLPDLPMSRGSMMLGTNHGDVTSGLHFPTEGFDMSFMQELFDLGEVFAFD